MKGLSGWMIVLLLGGLIVLSNPSILGSLGLQSASQAGSSGVVSVSSCPDTKTTNLDVRVRNILNSSEDYDLGTPTLVAFRSGTSSEQTRGTESAGGSYTTLSVDCNAKYDVVVLPVSQPRGAGVNGVIVKGINALGIGQFSGSGIEGKGRSVQVTVPAYQMGYPNCKVTNSIYSNLTAPDTATADTGWGICGPGASFVTTANEAFGTGTQNTYHVEFMTNSSGAYGAFGSNDVTNLPTYLCVDANPALYSIANGVTIAGLTPLVSVPDGAPKNDGFDKCWVISPIVSTDTIRDYAVNVFSDLGNPTTSDDVTWRLYDVQPYIGADGAPKVGTVNDAATDLGAVNVGVQIAIA